MPPWGKAVSISSLFAFSTSHSMPPIYGTVFLVFIMCYLVLLFL